MLGRFGVGLGVIRRHGAALGRVFGTEWAQIGDSFSDNSVTHTATTQQYRDVGMITWAMSLAKQSTYYPTANELGVGGLALASIKDQPSTVPSTAKLLLANGSINDKLTALGPGANTMIDSATALFNNMIALGNDVAKFYIPITDRLLDNDSVYRAKTVAYNNWVYAGGGTRTDGLPITQTIRIENIVSQGYYDGKQVIVLNIDQLMDPVTGIGFNNFAGPDGDHPSNVYAYVIGKQLAQVLPILGIATPGAPVKPNGTDLIPSNRGQFNVANNAGTKVGGGGFTASGNVGTGWQLNRGAGSSTTAGVADLVTDGDGVVWQKVVITTTVAGSGNEAVQVQLNPAISGGVSAGDVCQIGGRFKIVSAQTLLGVTCTLRESGPGSPQNDISHGGANQLQFEACEGSFKSPPITLQSGITGFITTLACNINSLLTGTSEVHFADVWVRKLS